MMQALRNTGFMNREGYVLTPRSLGIIDRYLDRKAPLRHPHYNGAATANPKNSFLLILIFPA